MLTITIPSFEYYDENTQEFGVIKEQTLNLEHSLLSISKWESKWKKPFLSMDNKPIAEFIDYIRCMTINSNVDKRTYLYLPRNVLRQVREYMDDSMTATWFSKEEKTSNAKKNVITSELIYFWMVSFQVPFECEKWHINRLLTLLHICEVKNAPSKKMSKKDLYARNRALNASRKKRLGTRG